VDVEGWEVGEGGAAGVELSGFFEGVDGGDGVEVWEGGGEGFAFVCGQR